MTEFFLQKILFVFTSLNFFIFVVALRKNISYNASVMIDGHNGVSKPVQQASGKTKKPISGAPYGVFFIGAQMKNIS